METPKDLSNAYQQFFLKTEHGQFFLKALDDLIDEQHRLAEQNGETARDFTQRAKGVRLIQEHIQSVTGGVKKT